jgi:parallel beta-helix repeat protein
MRAVARRGPIDRVRAGVPMLRRVVSGLVTAMVAGGVFLGVATPASAAAALRVSQDPSSCAGTFTTIQAAVDASAAGATIDVCPGIYKEQVRIVGHGHDGLKLRSLKPEKATIQWPTVESTPLALIDVNSANSVVVRGFVVSGPFTYNGCSGDRHEGVLIEGGASVLLKDNHITQIKNGDPSLYGCQEGDAVAVGRRSGVPSAGTATVSGNQIDEYQKNGVQVVNKGSVATIAHNVVRGSSAVQTSIASNGIVVFNGGVATINSNTVSNNKYTGTGGPLSTGISYSQAPSTVDGNLVYDNDFGIEVDSVSGGRIANNVVRTSVSDGIQLCGDTAQACDAVTNVAVQYNRVTNNKGSGIDLISATGDNIRGNHVSGNGSGTGDATDGIRLDAGSTQNHIEANTAHRNVTNDCYDASKGTATAGTANYWTNDKGTTQSALGLCDNADHGDHQDD